MTQSNIELSIVMPCLNEAETIALCIRQAHRGAQNSGIENYEIIVADNGSEDQSKEIALAEGAKVVDVAEKGYGAALRGGIAEASGKYVLMADSDASYDFSNIQPFIDQLRNGNHLVMGTRLKGKVKKGAMPWLHRYLGSPVLTFLGNLFFGAGISDFNCGMRAFDRASISTLNLQTRGMEFASEMIIRASISGRRIVEVPITYYPAGRIRAPHLRTWSDGWRHLRFLLLYSPRWLLLYPGIILSIGGLAASIILMMGPFQIGSVVFDIHTLLIAASALIVGVQLVFLAIFSRTYASRVGLLPRSERLEGPLEKFSLGLGLGAGLGLASLGLVIIGIGLVIWNQHSFGPLPQIQETMRLVIAGTILMILGIQTFFGSFVLSLISYR